MAQDGKCPACGSEKQGHVGRLWNRPLDVYRCAICDCLYGAVERQEPLSDEERRIARLTAEGWFNKQIAKQMGISLRTVHLKRSALMKKLGVVSKAELIRKVAEFGLCD